MGCNFSSAEEDLPVDVFKTEPLFLTERPSSADGGSPIHDRELLKDQESLKDTSPEDEDYSDEFYAEPPHSNTSLIFVRPAIISQLSDTVDLCGEMKEGDLRDASEEILERIVRIQFQVDLQGDAVPQTIVDEVQDFDTRFKTFLEQYANKTDDASVAEAQELIDGFDQELDTLGEQFAGI